MALENNPIGLVHSLLFSGPGNTSSVMRGEGKKEYVLNTMKWVLEEPGFESIEITRIKSSSVRKDVKSLLQKGLKDKQIQEVVYSAQPVQLINEDKICEPSDISSLDERERNKAVDRLKDCVDEALSYGFITKFAFYSGKDPVLMNGTQNGNAEAVRSQALSQLRRSVHELCVYIKDKSTAKNTLEPLIEVFDFRKTPEGTNFFKEALIGPIDRTEHFLESVRNLYGHPELGVMLDISHMVISGEGPDAMKNLAPYIRHVHIANVILNRNTANAEKRYGDVHPAFGVSDSEVDEEVLSNYLKALVEIDYQGTIAFELNPIDSEIPEKIAQSALSFTNKCMHRIDVNYALIHNFIYQNRKFFSEDLWDRLGELRVEKPQIIQERMKKRKMRKSITQDGKLVILAADHPARMVTNIPGDPTRMADRYDYLGRCARVMMASTVDGIMATADIIEDLVLIDHIYQEKTEKSFMDGKILIACLNRSGLAGATHEMLDRVTAYRDIKKIKEWHLDGAKMLIRFSIPDKYDRYVLQTMEECSRYVEACNDEGVPMFLEPLPVEYVDGKYKVIMTADALTRVIGIASGLSSSTSNLWLKIPYVNDYYRVAQAFSGPILMLGGESTGNPVGVLEQFVRGMGEGANVRGAMVGRNVLYPGQDDPAAVAEAVCDVCRKGSSALDAVRTLNNVRGHKMDLLPRE